MVREWMVKLLWDGEVVLVLTVSLLRYGEEVVVVRLLWYVEVSLVLRLLWYGEMVLVPMCLGGLVIMARKWWW